MSTRDLIETAERSLFLAKREGRTSADTLINGLGHAIPRDPFEKLRTIDLARFRNEGCILTTSLSPCTGSNNASAVSVCPLTPRWKREKGGRGIGGGCRERTLEQCGGGGGRGKRFGAQVVKTAKVDV